MARKGTPPSERISMAVPSSVQCIGCTMQRRECARRAGRERPAPRNGYQTGGRPASPRPRPRPRLRPQAATATTARPEDTEGCRPLRPFTYAAAALGTGPQYDAALAAHWDCSQPHIDDNVLLLDNELESDVEFVVGPDGDTWRIPGHRDVLSASSPVFKAMLTGPLAHDGKVRVEDVDGRAFYQLLRVLYGAVPEMRSERTTLLTMYAANKYLCPRLFVHCVHSVDGFLKPANVLRIMQATRVFVPVDMDVETAFNPSAPPLEDASEGEQMAATVDATTAPSTPLLMDKPPPPRVTPPSSKALSQLRPPSRSPSKFKRSRVEPGPPPVPVSQFPDATVEANMGWYAAALYWNCLEFVDAYIDDVFECECVEELHHQDLLMLLRRETLHVRREAHLFHALVRWADRDCKRRGVRVCADSKRAALGEALFLVRYLRMSMVELLDGPIKSGLLDPYETAWILGMAVGNPQPGGGNASRYNPPDTLRPFAHLLDAPRPIPKPCYLHLSPRSLAVDLGTSEEATMTDWSCPMDMSEAEVKRQVKALKQIAKMQKKEEKRLRRLEGQGQGQGADQRSGGCGGRKCSSGCFAEVFFSVLAFIFD